MWQKVDENFLREEVRCGYRVSSEMKRVWAVQLDLIARFKDVCERNKLKYFMSGGTLLGAARHRGFIPWDDDVDFLMPREDFERLKAIAPNEFKEPYFFQTEDNDPDIFLGGYARLRNSNTTYIERMHVHHNSNFGIYIDISVWDYLYEEQNKRVKQVNKIRYLQRLIFAKTYWEMKSYYDVPTLKWTLLKARARLSSRSRLCRQLLKALTCCKDSKYITCFSYHSDRYWPPCFEKDDYREAVLLEFEGMKLPAPIGYDHVLRVLYGDYMQYPPPEKRVPTHAGVRDPLLPYRNYLLDFEWFLEDIEDKTIIVFGAGKMFEYYMDHEGRKYPPEFVVDNNREKWGTEVRGIPVRPPDAVLEAGDNLRILICSIYYREISRQLRQMGIDDYYIYVQRREWL